MHIFYVCVCYVGGLCCVCCFVCWFDFCWGSSVIGVFVCARVFGFFLWLAWGVFYVCDVVVWGFCIVFVYFFIFRVFRGVMFYLCSGIIVFVVCEWVWTNACCVYISTCKYCLGVSPLFYFLFQFCLCLEICMIDCYVSFFFFWGCLVCVVGCFCVFLCWVYVVRSVIFILFLVRGAMDLVQE